MTTIPDLNTSSISFLGYYEVQDSEIKSGESFDPTKLNFGTDVYDRYDTHSAVTYDNAYKFELEDEHMNSTITLRAGNHNHKWITAHIKDYSSQNGGEFTGEGTDLSTYSEKNPDNLAGGQYDLMPWNIRGNWELFEPIENSLHSAIKRSLNSTSFWSRSKDNWRDSTLNTDNTGLYDYSVGGNHNISIFGSKGSDETCSIAFTPSTTIHKGYVAGVSNGNSNNWINEEYIGDLYSYTFDVTDILVNDKEIKLRDQETHPVFYVIVVWS